MKKILLCMFYILIILGCTGCQKMDQGEKDKIKYNFPTTYSKEVENVIFNTEVKVNEEVNSIGLYKTTAFPQKLDSDKAFDVLFDGIEVADSLEIDKELGREVQYIGKDDESLYMVKNHLNFSKDLFQYVIHSFHLEGEDYNADQYLTGEEFSFMGIDDAYYNIVKVISEFGMDISGEYHCYSLEHKKMEENEFAMDAVGKEDKKSYKDQWTEEDDSYFFTIHQIQQGCIVQYPIAGIFQEICDANAPVQVLYTKDGIVRLDIYEIFTFEQSDEVLDLRSFEEIADFIADKYNMILSDNKYEVFKAELFWKPVESEDQIYEMIPVWEISIMEKSSEKIMKMYVNALTAEEIL